MADNEESLQKLLSKWQERALKAEEKAAELEVEVEKRKSIFSSVPFRIAIAILISSLAVFALAFFFISLADRVTDISIPVEDVSALLSSLDRSEWVTDSSGIKEIARIFNLEVDGTLRIEKASNNAAFLIFSSLTVPVKAYDGIFSGVMEGVVFRLSFSESDSGDGMAVSIAAMETAIAFTKIHRKEAATF